MIAVWLGPPRKTLPFRARYVAYGVGLDVDDVLKVLVGAIPIESATVMLPEDRSEPAAVSGYRRALDASLTWHELGRHEFYAAARTRDVAIVIATGDQRHYANLLLTIGVRPDASAITS